MGPFFLDVCQRMMEHYIKQSRRASTKDICAGATQPRRWTGALHDSPTQLEAICYLCASSTTGLVEYQVLQLSSLMEQALQAC